MVTIKDLTLKYGEKVILNKINMDIERNKITIITGPSGIGKTSLFLCINGLIRLEKDYFLSGKILFNNNGKEIDLLSLDDDKMGILRKDIIYVSQHPDLLPMSIYNNLLFFAKEYKIKNPKDRIREILKEVFLYDEIKDIINKDVGVLSGGQQQRLILARALMLNPKVLLLDEPTASLNKSLSDKIEVMLKRKNITIVVISHFKSQINNLADKIYDLEKF